MSFIIILSCNSLAHSICTLLAAFVIYVNHFHQKANKQPLRKKYIEIENHKVNRQHWPTLKKFTTYTIKKWKHQLSFPIYRPGQVSAAHFHLRYSMWRLLVPHNGTQKNVLLKIILGENNLPTDDSDAQETPSLVSCFLFFKEIGGIKS